MTRPESVTCHTDLLTSCHALLPVRLGRAAVGGVNYFADP